MKPVPNPPPEQFRRLAIIGTGLMGGSLALAAREGNLCSEVLGVDIDPEATETALSLGIIDRAYSLEEAASLADCLVIATPPEDIERVMSVLAEQCSDGTLIMELASIKEDILERIDEICPLSLHFISVHPMAGRALSGPNAAQATLFRDAPLFLVPSVSTRPEAIERAEAFWRHLGARVFQALPAQHDQIVAGISHLPQLISYAMASTLADLYPDLQELRQFAGTGLKGMVRTAQSDPGLWEQILLLNQHNAQIVLDRFAQKVQDLQQALEAAASGETQKLQDLLAHSHQAGQTLNGEPSP